MTLQDSQVSQRRRLAYWESCVSARSLANFLPGYRQMCEGDTCGGWHREGRARVWCRHKNVVRQLHYTENGAGVRHSKYGGVDCCLSDPSELSIFVRERDRYAAFWLALWCSIAAEGHESVGWRFVSLLAALYMTGTV